MHDTPALPARGLRPARLLVAGLVAGLALATLPASAQWKWRDASGRVTASDMPPPREVADKDIIQRPAAATRAAASTAAQQASAAASAVTGASAPAKPPADKDLEARKRAADQQAKARAQAEEQRNAGIRADNCSRARQHLATMESGQRIARVNEKGEREVMDEQTRAAEVRRAREVIASDCR